MANSATLIDTINSRIGGAGPVFEYEIAIDTVDTALDVRTPGTTNRVFVVGIFLDEGTATNLTFKSASSKSQTLELATNDKFNGLTDRGYYFATKPGEKLSVQSSAAIGSAVGKNCVLRVIEAATFIAH